MPSSGTGNFQKIWEINSCYVIIWLHDSCVYCFGKEKAQRKTIGNNVKTVMYVCTRICAQVRTMRNDWHVMRKDEIHCAPFHFIQPFSYFHHHRGKTALGQSTRDIFLYNISMWTLPMRENGTDLEWIAQPYWLIGSKSTLIVRKLAQEKASAYPTLLHFSLDSSSDKNASAIVEPFIVFEKNHTSQNNSFQLFNIVSWLWNKITSLKGYYRISSFEYTMQLYSMFQDNFAQFT